MKRSIVVLAVCVIVVLFAAPVFASDLSKQLTGEKNIMELDAPYLAQFTPDLYAGMAVSKDIHSSMGSDDGWSFVGKITYTGTWFSLTPPKPEQ